MKRLRAGESVHDGGGGGDDGYDATMHDEWRLHRVLDHVYWCAPAHELAADNDSKEPPFADVPVCDHQRFFALLVLMADANGMT